MKIYRGLEYSLKIKKIIVESIKKANNNPFSNYYFIVDDPLFFEEAFSNILIPYLIYKSFNIMIY